MTTRTEFLRNANPHIWVEYTLFPTSEGGKTKSVSLGWGCPCFVEKDQMSGGFDAYPLLGDITLSPSEVRYLGLWFMNPKEAVPQFSKAGKFHLWEGDFIGQAVVKPDYGGMTGNERLYAAGLLEKYDDAITRKDQNKISELWKRVCPP